MICCVCTISGAHNLELISSKQCVSWLLLRLIDTRRIETVYTDPDRSYDGAVCLMLKTAADLWWWLRWVLVLLALRASMPRLKTEELLVWQIIPSPVGVIVWQEEGDDATMQRPCVYAKMGVWLLVCCRSRSYCSWCCSWRELDKKALVPTSSDDLRVANMTICGETEVCCLFYSSIAVDASDWIVICHSLCGWTCLWVLQHEFCHMCPCA